MLSKFLKLQNGTDIRGIAVENDSHEVNLTEEAVRAIALRILSGLRTVRTIPVTSSDCCRDGFEDIWSKD